MQFRFKEKHRQSVWQNNTGPITSLPSDEGDSTVDESTDNLCAEADIDPSHRNTMMDAISL
jgi:hypothetical protein